MHPTGGSADQFISPRNRVPYAQFHARRLVYDALRSIAPDVRGRVLDLGAGDQPYRTLFEHVDVYVAADVRTPFHTPPPGTVIFDGYHLPLRAGSLDWVLATEVFEHVRDAGSALSSVRGALRDGGSLVMTVPFLQPIHEPPEDYRRWTDYGLVAELTDAGFVDVEVLPLGNWHLAVAHLLRVYAGSSSGSRVTRWLLVRTAWCVSELVRRSPIKMLDDMCVGWLAIARTPVRT